MEHLTTDRRPSIGDMLERELELVAEAIAMVAGGGSPRVVVGGPALRRRSCSTPRAAMAAEAGVRARAALDAPTTPAPTSSVERIGRWRDRRRGRS